MKTGNERQGGVSDHRGQMQPMFGGGGGLDTCLVEEETLDFATGSSWRPPFGLALSQQSAPLFVTRLPGVKPVSNFILMEEFHRRPAFSSSHSSVQRSRAAKGHLFIEMLAAHSPGIGPLPWGFRTHRS